LVLGSGYGDDPALTDTQLAALDGLGVGAPQTVEIPGLGDYRVIATSNDDGPLITGLPLHDTDQAVSTLVLVELGLGALGTLAAGAIGWVVVRRQLRPLREVAGTAHRVAELPLASEVEVAERVPASLTDERTEVGQVGHALNTLLSHVETSLAARQRADHQVRQFVADAAHELRTPLATIAGYAELAHRRPEETGTALSKVEAESQRMTALVEDLLLLARLDAGRPLERETVDVTRLLLESVSDARVLAPDHHWRLDLPDEAVEVTGDGARLHQVVSNLLTNARRYTPAGTTVTVRARPGLIEVHDDGPGFPPELVDRAFERFVRADTARSRTGGTGLGLALVRAIVTAHGGTVELETEPGDTTVRVRLRPGRPG
jgi:two-component system OmpR family sensor kinase